MRELVADRREEGFLVCISDDDTVLVPCPDIVRPEGYRLLLFEAVNDLRTPYVSISAAFSKKIDANDNSALLIPPDKARQKAVKARFDRIFKGS